MKTNQSYIKTCLAVTLSILGVFYTLTSFSQNWTGNLNSSWNNPANWSAWPLNGADIVINPANYTGASSSPLISSESVFVPSKLSVVNGATLTVQNNLTINGDVIIDIGGIITLNSGIISIGQNLTISDGKTSNPSALRINDGELVVGGNMNLKNVVGNYSPRLSMHLGTLKVNGDLTWFGQSPGTGTPRLYVKGGMVNLKGKLINLPGSTVNLYVSLENSSALNYSGNLIKTINFTDSIIQKHPASFTLSGTGSWEHNGIFYSNNATTVFNSSISLYGVVGEYVFHNVNINSGKIIDYISPTHITVKGNFINDGIFDSHLNSMLFIGTSPQLIGGGGSSTFGNFICNNTSSVGISLGQPLTVTEVLGLFSGKVNTSSTNLLTLSDGAIANIGSATSFVNGPMKKIGNEAFEFPIGKSNILGRLRITAPASANSEFTAEYIHQAYANTTSLNSPLTSVSGLEHWSLVRSNSTDSVRVSLYWENASLSGISNCTDLTMARWNGSEWDKVACTYTGSCSGTGDGKVNTTKVYGDFGIFTFGFTTVVTGIKDHSLSKGVTVYPNPNNGTAIIELRDNYNNASIRLIDMSGRIIESKIINEKIYELNYSSQPAGIYYLEVNQNGIISRLKIMKI